jgi:RecB family endonuclease NucS
MAKQFKTHHIVLRKPDGGVEVYRMKEWLRQHPDELPAGLSAETSTSHELRRALRRKGWSLEIRPDEVRLIKPAEDGDVSFADELSVDSETAAADDQEELAEEITFGLERDLQMALRRNIEQLEPGLKIIDGGKERTTDAGRVDIMAADTGGTIAIIELKAGTASPEVVAQILAYMGAVAETDGKPVRGILVAGDFHPRVVLAARAIPNLQLKKYSFQFTFEGVK